MYIQKKKDMKTKDKKIGRPTSAKKTKNIIFRATVDEYALFKELQQHTNSISSTIKGCVLYTLVHVLPTVKKYMYENFGNLDIEEYPLDDFAEICELSKNPHVWEELNYAVQDYLNNQYQKDIILKMIKENKTKFSDEEISNLLK